MKNVSFKVKMSLLLVLVLATITFLSLFNNYEIKRFNQKAREMTNGYNYTLLTLDNIVLPFYQEIEFPLLLNKDKPLSQDIVNKINNEILILKANVKKLTKNYPAEYVQQIAAEINKGIEQAQNIVSLKTKMGKQSDMNLLAQYYTEFVGSSHMLRTLLSKFYKREIAEREFALKKLNSRYITIRNNNLWIGGVVFLLILGFSIWFITDIVSSFKMVYRVLQRLSLGDLTYKVNIKSRDEASAVIYRVEKLREQLLQTITKVYEMVENLTAASRDLSSSSQNISQGASEQASSAEEVSSSIEEMAANIHQNANNAKKAADISKKLASSTSEMVNAAETSQKQINEIAKKVAIINEIAFQTNILALNASVEAARAGEQGKGFGVVAHEVGKLADRSKAAAAEIDELAQTSVKVIENAGKFIKQIVPEINSSSQMVESIDAASEEQQLGADQISEAILQLNEVTQQNAAASEEIATSAQELSSQSETLLEALTFFKLGKVSNEYTKSVSREPSVTKPKHLPFSASTQTGKKGVHIDLGKKDTADDEFERF